MGRRLQADIVEHDGRFTLRVPRRRGSTRRVQGTFVRRDEAERWRAAALDALGRGQEPPDPTGYQGTGPEAPPRAAAQPRTFSDVAWEWWEQRYVVDRRAQPARRDEVARTLRQHLIPYFDRAAPTIDGITQRHCIDFARQLAGKAPSPARGSAAEPTERLVTLREAAALTGKSKTTLRHHYLEGRMPNAIRRPGHGHQGTVYVPVSDLVKLGFTVDGVASARGQAYSRSYAAQLIRDLRNIMKWAKGERLIADNPAENTVALAPEPHKLRRPPNKRRPVAFELGQLAGVPRHTHIHYVLAMWIVRLVGLRISQILEVHGEMGIHVGNQGGRPFGIYDSETGREVWVTEKESTKTEAGDRLIVVPRQLAELIRTYIAAFHEDQHGNLVDQDALLIIPITPGAKNRQEGFRAALAKAFRAEGLDFNETGFYASAHHLRKSCSSELAWADIPERIRSMFLGHEVTASNGGAEVTARSYTLRMADMAPFIDAANALTDAVANQMESLYPPRHFRAVNGFRTKMEPDRALHAEEVLTAAGLVADTATTGELVTCLEAARMLGVRSQCVRGWIRDGLLECVDIPIHSGGAQRFVPLVAVERRLSDLGVAAAGGVSATGETSVLQLAAAAGVSADAIRATIRRLGLELERDPRTGAPIVDEASARKVHEDLARMDRLQERSMLVPDAARALGLTTTGVRRLYQTGQLEVDPESRGTGRVYLTRSSIAEAAAVRLPGRPLGHDPSAFPPATHIPLAEVMTSTGLGRVEALALKREGVTWRRALNGQFYAERVSFERYLEAQLAVQDGSSPFSRTATSAAERQLARRVPSACGGGELDRKRRHDSNR